MEEYIIIKKGSSIHHCINIPEEFMGKELEIKIRPCRPKSNNRKKIELLFADNKDVKPFNLINDPRVWQREVRSEW